MGLKHSVRRQVVDCVIEGRVKRLTRLEMLALIKSRTGERLSIRSLDSYIRAAKERAPERLRELKESRYALLDEVFKTKDEIERLIQESWILYRTNKNNPQLQLNCIHEIHQLTVTHSNIIDILPAYQGMNPNNGRTEKETILSNVVPAEQRGNSQAVF